jgi:peptide/nickel transport system substrate-binding protein
VLDYGNVALKPDADALRQTNPNIKAHYNVATAMIGLWLNLREKPWDDVRVRKALALAVDRDEVIIGDRQGGAVYTSFIPPFYKDYAWSQETMKQRFQTNRDRAKELQAEAGYARPAQRFVFRTSRTYAQGAENVHQHLEAIGIPTTLSVEPTGASAPVIAKGDFDLAYGATRVGRLLGAWADLVATGSQRNVAHYSDPAVDELVVAQEREMDPVKRKQLLDQMQDRLYEDMPYVPVITPMYFRFYSCQAQNLSPVHNTLAFYGLKHAWLDAAGC